MLRLINNGAHSVDFTVTAQNYSEARPRTYHVRPHGRAEHLVNPLQGSKGWYDLTVKLHGDSCWSRRYIGHLENGGTSITG